MIQPRVIVLSGYGINCEDETKHAFEIAGASVDIVHVNDLIGDKKKLSHYQVMAVPGGFAYGDDTGSGRAYANKLKNHLEDELEEFVAGDRLVLGICNGFQIIARLGLVPGALLPNTSARYVDRWVDLKIEGESPWFRGIEALSAPIAHGEGRYFAKGEVEIAATYTEGEICAYHDLPANPNGSMKDIAAVTARDGRIVGMMPHPERAMYSTQLPHWPYLKEKLRREGKKLPLHGPGLKVFQNAVAYFG